MEKLNGMFLEWTYTSEKTHCSVSLHPSVSLALLDTTT